MAFTRIVKVERLYLPSGEWRVYDEKREHVEYVVPDQWLHDAMGAREQMFWRATWSKDESWIFDGSGNYRVKHQHWEPFI